ncbi:MAG: acetyl-CoA carboxylase biotin carboxyl carrier protein [Ignavibacteriales bacterium]|nr:acetyl-CoA carboxylase biotin carboxyl carrier protein [Ignavibacteriales bacterium]
MDLSYIKKIIRLVENSDVDEIEIEEEGKKIRVAKHRNSMVNYPIPMPGQYPLPPTPSSGLIPQLEAPASEAKPKPEVHYHEIRSPIVGTFYRAPAPDAESYVEVGQTIKSGDVLCIVEAMKLMNEIESDVDGKVVKILVENGKPVEYNQVLFHVEKS